MLNQYITGSSVAESSCLILNDIFKKDAQIVTRMWKRPTEMVVRVSNFCYMDRLGRQEEI